jgi:hypothetical protein
MNCRMMFKILKFYRQAKEKPLDDIELIGKHYWQALFISALNTTYMNQYDICQYLLNNSNKETKIDS